ncbi:hypothetical protein [Paenibacillus lacisoli]|uniref:hypothetical protein n=1 Tax=Paenibacillus lacisoli TaxID=3064525 RepID=UPI002729BA92|nr:hypothetical protein [Paenibacillus sp. JX-17]
MLKTQSLMFWETTAVDCAAVLSKFSLLGVVAAYAMPGCNRVIIGVTKNKTIPNNASHVIPLCKGDFGLFILFSPI